MFLGDSLRLQYFDQTGAESWAFRPSSRGRSQANDVQSRSALTRTTGHAHATKCSKIAFPLVGFRFIFRRMSTLRLLLIVGNALLFAWTVYIFPSSHATVHTSDYVFGFGVLTCSGFNLVYLLLNLVGAPTASSDARRVTAER